MRKSHANRRTPSHDTGLVADVLLPLNVPHPFTYRIRSEQKVQPGAFVRVPLGARTAIGVVWDVRPATPADARLRLRQVTDVFDFPPMPPARRRFVEWMADYYVASPGMVLKLFLGAPAALAPPRSATGWRATQTPEEARAAGLNITEKRARVLRLAQQRALPGRDLMQRAGVGASVIRWLKDTGLLRPEPLTPPAVEPPATRAHPPRIPTLTPEQREAAERLRTAVGDTRQPGGFSVHLLDGITGSGKTEVYFEAMARALDAGRQVLLLLPEIALTAGFVQRVEERFGIPPVQWHSQVGKAERERAFRAVALGRARIVVAARSGLFLPWKNLGLIVVDEEHEPAYKQETHVPYQGRDMAVMLGRMEDIPVILASATPSLESLVNVRRGRYEHVRLRRRYGAARLPEIDLVDLKEHRPEPGCWISPPLVDATAETLERGEQALFFINRRGYAPLTLCRACGHRLQCPRCSAWLVRHRGLRGGGEILLCHHCGHMAPLPSACPECGAEDRLAAVGPGVERLAEEAARRWPDARIITLSSDLLQGPRLRLAMEEIARGEHDIVVGTQLVAKGHHFPRLTLVGVIDADLALETVDPRAGERTWQLMAQVAGRAGREDRPGRALIQTHLPDTPLMRALKAGDRDAFIEQEIRAREAARMPPFGRLAAVIASGSVEEELRDFCMALARHRPPSDLIALLGPAPAPIGRLRGRYRYRFLLKGPRKANVQAYLRAWLNGVAPPGDIRLDIDVDPYNFL